MIEKVSFGDLFKKKTSKLNNTQEQTGKKNFIQKIKEGDKKTVAFAAIGAALVASYTAITLVRKFNPSVIINSIKKTDEIKDSGVNTILKVLDDYSIINEIDGEAQKTPVLEYIKKTYEDALCQSDTRDILEGLRKSVDNSKKIRFSYGAKGDKLSVELLDEDKLIARVTGINRELSDKFGIYIEKTPNKSEHLYFTFSDKFDWILKDGEKLQDHMDEMIVDRGLHQAGTLVSRRYVYQQSGDKEKHLVIKNAFKNFTLLENLEAANAKIEYSPDGNKARVYRFVNKYIDEPEKKVTPVEFVKNSKGVWVKTHK